MKKFMTTVLAAVVLSSAVAGQVCTLQAREPPKAKKPTLTLISLNCVKPSDSQKDISYRFYFAGEETDFDRASTRLKAGQVQDLKYLGKKTLKRTVVVQLWQRNTGIFEKDDKLGEAKILTDESGEQIIAFTGSNGGVRYRYEVKYRVDR